MKNYPYRSAILSPFIATSFIATSFIAFPAQPEYLAARDITDEDTEDFEEEEDDSQGCCPCPCYEDEDLEEDWAEEMDTWPGRREDSWFKDLEH